MAVTPKPAPLSNGKAAYYPGWKVRTAYPTGLLMQFKKTGHVVVSLADFKEWLQIDEVYHRFSNLKMRVIDPAVAELQAKSGLTIAWQGHRNGRAVQRLEFRFTMNGDPPPMVDRG